VTDTLVTAAPLVSAAYQAVDAVADLVHAAFATGELQRDVLEVGVTRIQPELLHGFFERPGTPLGWRLLLPGDRGRPGQG